jgi:hypothetical protein
MLLAASSSLWAQIATFQMLTSPTQNTWANFALSRDGKVMAANYGGEIYRWTPNGGFVDLGPGDPNSSSIAISHDGSTIVSSLLGSNHAGTPGLWKQVRAGRIWAIPPTDASWTMSGAAGTA